MEEGKVTVARILIDSIIDKQGLLRPGDVIVEANGQKIKNPEQLQEVILFSYLNIPIILVISLVCPARSGLGTLKL